MQLVHMGRGRSDVGVGARPSIRCRAESTEVHRVVTGCMTNLGLKGL